LNPGVGFVENIFPHPRRGHLRCWIFVRLRLLDATALHPAVQYVERELRASNTLRQTLHSSVLI